MEKKMKQKLLNSLLAPAIAMCLAFNAIGEDKIPDKTHDGLVRIQSSDLALVYKNPKAEVEPYTSVQILDCFVAFKKNWEREHKFGPDRLSTSDMSKIKDRLAEQFSKVFKEELNKAGYKVVDKAGDDVLIIRPAIINLNVEAPDTMKAGITRTFSYSSGSMTLFMELYDGPTSDIIARVYDPQADRGTGFMEWRNRAENTHEARLIIKKWVSVLIKHLDRVKAEKGT